MEIIDKLISVFLMIIISTSLTVIGQPSPRFHVEAWLPFRNCEIVYYQVKIAYVYMLVANLEPLNLA